MDATNNISLPEPLLAEIQNAAEAEHRSVDEVLTDAVKRYVEERSWTKLLEYGRSGLRHSASKSLTSTV
jgi:metal-responsive CopG/Arc/MetJ family transcriptional regulator